MPYTSEEEIWQEIVSLTPPFTGITYERLEQQGSPGPVRRQTIQAFSRALPTRFRVARPLCPGRICAS